MPRVVPSQIITFIDQVFPWAKNQTGGKGSEVTLSYEYSTQFSGLINLIEQIPGDLIDVTDERYVAYVAGVAAIKDIVEVWRNRGATRGLESIRGLGLYNPVTHIRRALDECPDKFPSSRTVELGFISDKNIRHELRMDISAVNTALVNGEWKATTVLAGSVIEALLLWALDQRKKKNAQEISNAISVLQGNGTLTENPGNNLENWTLHPFIAVTSELGIIRSETAIQASLTKDFRNLIHPGRVLRKGIQCDRGTALTAVAAVEQVLRDITP